MKFFGFEIRRLRRESAVIQALQENKEKVLTAMVAVSEPPPPPKKTQKVKVLKHRLEKLNVQKTILKVTFEDGTHFHTAVYGHAMPQQMRQHGRSAYTPNSSYHNGWADKVFIFTSEDNVRSLMSHIVGGHHANFMDDVRKPTISRSGIPRTVKVVKTVDHFDEVDVFYTEEEELEL